VAEEGVDAVEAGAQPALDVVDGVEQAGVGLDLRRASSRTEPGSQTRALSLRSTSVHIVSSTSSFSELISALSRAASSIASLPRRRGARDRAGLDAVALDAHEHLGAGADQLLVAELDQELVGLGLIAVMRACSSEGGSAQRALEGAAQHHLEHVADADALARAVDHRRVLGIGEVAGDRRRASHARA
jgi:hypothetical protein